MKTSFFLICFLLSSFNAYTAEEKVFYSAPSRLANTDRQMNTAGFWIGRHPAPDQVVMTTQQIEAFNAHVQNELKLTKDIFAVTENFKTESLVNDFEKTLAEFNDKGLYTAAGGRNDKGVMEKFRRNMNLPGVVVGVAPRYALVAHYADVRFFPSEEPLYETAGDVDFDQLQNSTLDVGTPVAVVHQSMDKKWYYCLTPLSDGWVQADRIALGSMKMVKDYVQNKNFAIVTTAKADIFLNEGLTRYHDHARMGTRLPMAGASMDKVSVFIPSKDAEDKLQIVEGYMESKDIHEGYLPYTPRAIYTQAFAMLNQPYGWGGMYGQQDCSAFLDEVFATAGIVLPRDSKDQAQVGQALAEFDEKSKNDQKLRVFKEVLGATAILPMKGHIMLYLGAIDGRAYAIHAIWAYREHKNDKDVPRVINRVIVSDLSLGEGSHKGSLLKRLSKVIEIK